MFTRASYLLIICFLISLTMNAQYYCVKGIVFDASDNKPLAFVNIVINGGKSGGSTDIDGKFSLCSKDPIEKLRFTYVGYETLIYEIKERKPYYRLKLQPTEYELSEVEVFPTENPAHRIIRNVINNRDINDPKMLKSFSYTSYDKMIFTIDDDSLFMKEISLLDTTEKRIRKVLDEQHLFMMETVTERKYLHPEKDYEKVIASKVSGLKDPLFVFMISQMQSTSFYNEMISIMDKRYINPISKGSLKKYLFLIEDTAYAQKNDTVFIISYRPRRKTNFEGMKGVLSINSNKWAIQNVIAEPAKEGKGVNVKIQQMYKQINDEYWFPVQLNTEIRINFMEVGADSRNFKVLGIGKSYIKDIILNPELVASEFKNVEVEVADDAYKRDDIYWDKYRTDTLTNKEKRTYEVLDSLGREYDFDKLTYLAKILITGGIPWGFIDLEIDKILHYNDYEGLYLGMGIQTNNRWSKIFKIGGYWGYGFKDKAAKYGGHIKFNLYSNWDLEAGARYFYDVTESGGVKFLKDDRSLLGPENFRNLVINRMNKTESLQLLLSFRMLKHFKIYVDFSNTFKEAYKDYQYGIEQDNCKHFINDYRFTELTMGTRFAFREKFIKAKSLKFSLGTKYPVAWFQYTRGFNNLLNGEFAYNRYDMKIDYSFYIKYFGNTSLRLMVGYIDGDLPYCNLYNGHGSYSPFMFFVPYSFGTMRMNEFFSNKYLSLYISHNFGKLLLRKERFEPEFVFITNFTIGTLDNPDKHFNTEIKTLKQGYYESGIMINKLLKMQILSVGVGALYRYGPYGFDDVWDNFGVKLTVTYPFRMELPQKNN